MAKIFSVFRNDYDNLASFITYFFRKKGNDEEFWLDRFNFWWDSNPAFSENIERGWVLKDKGRIVGFRGIIPTKFQLFGKQIVAYNSTTWRVSRKHRNQSMVLFFKVLNASKDTLHFDTTPTGLVVELMNIYKYRKIPGSYAKISMLKVSEKRCFNLSKKSRMLDTKQIIKAESSFNRLWERTKNIFSNTNVRTADVINWYLKDKIQRKIAFGCYQHNELIGYVICWIRVLKGYRVLQWVDLWGYHPIKNDVLDSLVNYTVEYAKNNSFECVIFTHFTNNVGKYFKKMDLLEIDSEKLFYFKANPDTLNKITGKNSFFVDIQGDYCLC